jgi:hypothetical protein
MSAQGHTIRQQILFALRGGLLTAKELSKAVGIREPEVLAHLPHVARSLGRPARFVVEPSACLDCGFVFRKRTRLKTPGKCPVCKSEGVTETRYGVLEG